MFFNSIFKKMELYKQLLSKAKELGHRDDVAHCIRCSYCCWQRPCSLSKEDLKIISQFLNRTETEFFNKFCAVDDLHGEYTVILLRKGQEADLGGKWVPSDRTFDFDTPCIFLGNTKDCLIHEVKPQEGFFMSCGKKEKSKYVPWTKEDLKNLGWGGDVGNEDIFEN